MSEASQRDWLRRLIEVGNNSNSNPPGAPQAKAAEPDGALALFSHDALRVPSGDRFDSAPVKALMKRARAL